MLQAMQGITMKVKRRLRKQFALPLGLWNDTVAQWLLADTDGRHRGVQSLIEKLRQTDRQTDRLAGMSPEERKVCKHTKNLMRYTCLAGISYRQFYLTSTTFRLFLPHNVCSARRTKQKKLHSHYYGSWSRSEYCVCVCVCVWLSECVSVCVSVCVCERERERSRQSCLCNRTQ